MKAAVAVRRRSYVARRRKNLQRLLLEPESSFVLSLETPHIPFDRPTARHFAKHYSGSSSL